MKSFVRMAMLLCVAASSLLTACRKEEQVTELGQEPKTAIEQMEKEAGKSFFKKDLVLRDASGQNEVLLRVASQSEEMLINYLAIHRLTITPIFKQSAGTVFTEQINPEQSKASEKITKPEATIVTEAISQKLEANAIGYSLGVEVDNSKLNDLSKKGRIMYLDLWAEHISEPWPTYLRLTVNPRGRFIRNEIRMKITVKDAWYNFWRDWFTYSDNWLYYHSTETDGQYMPSVPQTYTDVNVDGPWKARAEIVYDMVPACSNCIPSTDQPTVGYVVTFIR